MKDQYEIDCNQLHREEEEWDNARYQAECIVFSEDLTEEDWMEILSSDALYLDLAAAGRDKEKIGTLVMDAMYAYLDQKIDAKAQELLKG